MIIRIEDLNDPRLDVYSRITDAQLKNEREPERGLFIAESRKVIERAIASGVTPVSLFMEERWLPSTQELIDSLEAIDPEIPIFVATNAQMRELTGYEVTRGALGVFYRPPVPSVEEVCRNARRIAVLEDITNYTNIGAIFRSAAALGIDAVLVTPLCHDPLYRRAARVSMGTVFQVPWARIGEEAHDWATQGVPLLHKLGFKTVALALKTDSIGLDDPRLQECEKLAIVLGTEGDGLSETTISSCDYTVRIPMAHGVDSLNVAAASAVAFWELRVC
jgi:tRNA G18 (ribose-2'-O)-methylase SpoU